MQTKKKKMKINITRDLWTSDYEALRLDFLIGGKYSTINVLTRRELSTSNCQDGEILKI